MHFIKKRRNKPLYKKFLTLRKNVQQRQKLLSFKNKKWQKFQQNLLLFKKKKLYDPTSYFISTFLTFHSKKFKNNLHNKQKLSLFYGNLRKNYLKKLTKFTLQRFKNLHKQAVFLFIENLETRLDTVLYRTHFCYSLANARQLILHKKILVNNKIVQSNSCMLKKGDLITFDKTAIKSINLNIFKIKNLSIPPKHLYVNYKTFQILTIDNANYTNCLVYYPFWIDFISFLKFYER